ncbi:hypothetical protein [Salegentibacter maritimus]|uniref:hypothetical protein n=1 Tax=Salegentibacter maritimus TaxID=2794347 RepID=UPI0018E47A47|nr:hypothetical protein [Salegentibacter maritimus]MBI6117893.1 hypothetical protein [Salegentibacter maritimus]
MAESILILPNNLLYCLVECARFEGTTMDVFIDKKEYTGDIFSILENTQNFILNHTGSRTFSGHKSSYYHGLILSKNFPQVRVRIDYRKMVIKKLSTKSITD